ncbi:receptor-like serine/threonine-protein kinase ALE2 isoform X2 [Magnolia sinica]|uniref:receptor-like serine/threonine-protein kinase ALE2 isoform X2 n=1 Tax=Magnolia sinica TaxID=86752 RepID=UPI0026588AB2|nr:receptor-like serine/threonine-protein kinase ALE2 isoform X2 [Magnolia sinica]
MEQRAVFLALFLCVVGSLLHGSKGFAKSPSPTMPHALPPIEERTPSSGHHGKPPRKNTSSPVPLPKGPISPLPTALPPKSELLPPIIQGPLPASVPQNAPTHHISKEHKHPRGASPSAKNQTPHAPSTGISPVTAPPGREGREPSNNGSPLPIPFLNPKPPASKRVRSPASAPAVSISFHKHHARKNASSPASAPSHVFPPPSYHQGPVIPQAPSQAPVVLTKRSRHKPHGPPPSSQGASLSPTETPSPTTEPEAPTPSPSVTAPSSQIEVPIYPPTIYSSGSSPRKPRIPARSPARALPPPPPNQDCSALSCREPLTNTPPGSPCGCVLPMQVGLRLGVALLTFFTLVAELAQEIASGVFMKQSQVRIMGANTAIQNPGETDVFLDLVPFGEKFDNITTFLMYENFWHKRVVIKISIFGDYQVLYVRYPGLPPSPPLAPTDITINDAGQLPRDNHPRALHPFGVDVRKQKERLDGSLIAVIVLSSAILLVFFLGAMWLLLWKLRNHTCQPAPTLQTLVPLGKPSGAGSIIFGSGPSSPSLSFGSSIATYTGSAKTFSLAEMEKATDNFDASTILGEGGFGRVFKGVLEDGTKVAVKVLKRDDRQGTREFLAEVEMLSRLHHRNLVKLIGICTEEHSRSLVYELIPNGSVESHLHGVDKETASLDWDARTKIALGSARGLAYLHEDSSPRVIHRDFKSSNILLEYDFTPKVSDFGLAKTALDEESEHISTRIVGTFGYVAPEYAMTGHLLVKSDVYSYGVVLLELLTGKKPIDMTQPPGQENLVTWARPLLTSKEGLQMLIDPALGPDFPFDSVAKVAAIASMCVQPEVTHRPFMGEVVQALKLVCNECDEKRGGSGSCSQDNLSPQDTDTRVSIASGQLPSTHSFLMANYGSGLEAERVLSTSDIFSTSARFTRHESGSFRRHSSSGPLRMTRHGWFWQRGLSSGSVSEHGIAFKLWAGSDGGRKWP